MTQPSASRADSDTDMDQDMVIDPNSRLLVTQTRDLTLVSPGVPVSNADMAAAHWLLPLSSPAPPAASLSSSSSSSVSSPAAPSHDSESGNATSLGDKPHMADDAQPSPLASPSTCATFGAEEQSHGTSCQSEPGIGTVEPGPDEGGAVGILFSSQGHGQGHHTQAIADQPAISFPTMSCHPPAHVTPPASLKRALSALLEPEGETTAAKEGGVLMKRPAAGKPVHRSSLYWAARLNFDGLPNEVLMHVLSFLEVCDLLATSRTNHHLRTLSLQPILHRHRLRRARLSLPSLLISPSRPTLRDLIARRIFLTNTTQVSRRLARNLVAIRLSRRLPLRPPAEVLVQRGVLPGECVEGSVAPGLVAKKRAVERERLKDGLRRWVGGVWTGEVRQRGEGVKQWEESRGVGRVWRLRRFWERVSTET